MYLGAGTPHDLIDVGGRWCGVDGAAAAAAAAAAAVAAVAVRQCGKAAVRQGGSAAVRQCGSAAMRQCGSAAGRQYRRTAKRCLLNADGGWLINCNNPVNINTLDHTLNLCLYEQSVPVRTDVRGICHCHILCDMLCHMWLFIIPGYTCTYVVVHNPGIHMHICHCHMLYGMLHDTQTLMRTAIGLSTVTLLT